MKTYTSTATRSIIIVEKPFRHDPRIPAIFCSCGVRPELVVSLPIQLARFRMELVSVTTSAKMLKSRSCATSYGFMKLCSGTRSHRMGEMSTFHENFNRMKPTIITKIG